MLLLLLSHFSHVWLCNLIGSSLPGSPVPGILQARTLEWVAISFSNARKWKVKVKTLSRVRLLATPWTAAHQAPPSMGFSRQEYWSGLPLPSPKRAYKILNFGSNSPWSHSLDFITQTFRKAPSLKPNHLKFPEVWERKKKVESMKNQVTLAFELKFWEA